MKEKPDIILLRKEAEKILEGLPGGKKKPGHKRELSELLHELQIYQVELEMQNDELRLAQVALEQEKMRFADLFSLAPVGYFILNNTAVIKKCNETGLHLLDLNDTQVMNRRFPNFVANEDTDAFYLFIRALLLKKMPAGIQLKMKSYTGRVFYCQVQGTIIRDQDDSKIQFYLAMIDITEKRLAEIRQNEINERLQMALNASSSGTWKINLKSGIVELDNFAATIFDVDNASFKGKFTTLYNKVHPGDQAAFDRAIRESMRKTRELHIEFRILKGRNSIHYVQAHGHVTSLENEKDFFIGLLTDVTTAKVLELESNRLKEEQNKKLLSTIIETQENERLRISNALHDSVGQLLYGTSLKLQHAASTKDKSFIEALQLLNQAIRETRKISFELAPSILTDFGLTIAIPEMTNRINSTSLAITSEITGFEKRLPLSAETFIFRVLQELLNNVIKHASATFCEIKIQHQTGNVTINVQDNGKGFINKKKHEGTGLYSIKNRIAVFNGALKINSRKNKGTEILINLYNIK